MSAAKLKRTRKKMNLSQRAFAKVIKLCQRSIVRYERGQRKIPANVMKRLERLADR